MKLKRVLVLFICLLTSAALRAELVSSEAEEVAQSFRTKVIQAVNLKDSSEMASYFDENAILVLGNSQVIRTRANIEAYMEAPYLEDEVSISRFVIDSFDIDPGMVILDEDTFIATGTTVYEIIFTKTKEITLPSRWVAVLHRTDGVWKVASYQGTVNVFSNPLLDKLTHLFYLISAITFILGIILTLVWKRFKKAKIQ